MRTYSTEHMYSTAVRLGKLGFWLVGPPVAGGKRESMGSRSSLPGVVTLTITRVCSLYIE